MDSYFTCLRCAFSLGTFLWKASQIHRWFSFFFFSWPFEFVSFPSEHYTKILKLTKSLVHGIAVIDFKTDWVFFWLYTYLIDLHAAPNQKIALFEYATNLWIYQVKKNRNGSKVQNKIILSSGYLMEMIAYKKGGALGDWPKLCIIIEQKWLMIYSSWTCFGPENNWLFKERGPHKRDIKIALVAEWILSSQHNALCWCTHEIFLWQEIFTGNAISEENSFVWKGLITSSAWLNCKATQWKGFRRNNWVSFVIRITFLILIFSIFLFLYLYLNFLSGPTSHQKNYEWEKYFCNQVL